ncbi:MAG TPA: hypothetical protein PL064_10595 [Thermogutta sp.]|nr:hypothetical protein [Thermogutta sp.]
MAIYKTTYRGRAIYYYPGAGYGDETNVLYRTMKEAKAAIDAAHEEEQANMAPHESYWSTLDPSVRAKYRRDPRIWEHEHGAAGVAYDDAVLAGQLPVNRDSKP